MELKRQTIKELKNILEKDYGVLLSDNTVNEFGSSLLRLTRLAIIASEKIEKNTLKAVPHQLPDTRYNRTYNK